MEDDFPPKIVGQNGSEEDRCGSLHRKPQPGQDHRLEVDLQNLRDLRAQALRYGQRLHRRAGAG
eukprot:12187188-Heterocapsa_arctica.AAC.1